MKLIPTPESVKKKAHASSYGFGTSAAADKRQQGFPRSTILFQPKSARATTEETNSGANRDLVTFRMGCLRDHP